MLQSLIHALHHPSIYTLYTVCFFLLLIPTTASPLISPEVDDGHNLQPTTSIIDILSSSAQFSTLISHLQRLDLIPVINEARNITFFAPTNNAFLDIKKADLTRDRFLYHILNTTFLSQNLLENEEKSIEIHPTFLHSTQFLHTPNSVYHQAATSPKHPSNKQPHEEPATNATSIPLLLFKIPTTIHYSSQIPIVDNSGAHQSNIKAGQQPSHPVINIKDDPLEIAVGNSPNSPVTIVDRDLKASKYRGVVQVIEKLLEVPKPLCQILSENENISLFYKLFSMEYDCSKPIFANPVTLLAPSDNAFLSQLNDIEKDYLFSEWGRDDRKKLLARHLIDSGLVASPLIRRLSTLTSSDDEPRSFAIIKASDGYSLNITDGMVVNGFQPLVSNTIAADGIVHFYDDFISGEDGNIHSLIQFTPEKYMLALGAEAFTKELKFRGLSYLVDGSSTDAQTVFVPKDDSESSILRKSVVAASNTEKLANELKHKQHDMLKDGSYDPDLVFAESVPSTMYHFVYGQHILDSKQIANSNMLLTSKATFKRLGNHSQRIKVVANEDSGEIYLNGRDVITNGPFNCGNTTIYIIDGTLDPPPTLDLAIASVLQASRSATYLQDLGLFNLPAASGWTVLLPTSIAWKQLGLVTKYLETNMTALRSVMESHLIRHPFYSDSEPIDTQLYDGTNVTVSTKPIYKRAKPAFQISSDISSKEEDLAHTKIDTEYYPLEIYVDYSHYHVETANILSSSGVIHAVNQISIPENVEVTATNILESVGATSFIDLLHARNMSYVLDPKNEYTLLVFSNKVMEANNITVDTPNIDLLLRMHVLPGNPIDYFLDGGKVQSLAEDVHLTAKEIDSGLYLVSIVEGESVHEVRVLSRGDTTLYYDDDENAKFKTAERQGKKSTILYIDRYLSPDWVTNPVPPFTPPFHLRTPFAILLGVVFGAILIFGIMSVALVLFLGRWSACKSHSSNNSENGSIGSSHTNNGENGLLNPNAGPDYGSMNGGAVDSTSPENRPLLSRNVSSNSANSKKSNRHRSSRKKHRSAPATNASTSPNNGVANMSSSVNGYLTVGSQGSMYGFNSNNYETNGNNQNNNLYYDFTDPNGNKHNNNALPRRDSTFSQRSVSSMTSEHSVSEPIPTGKVLGGREHGKHLNLPRV